MSLQSFCLIFSQKKRVCMCVEKLQKHFILQYNKISLRNWTFGSFSVRKTSFNVHVESVWTDTKTF